MENSQDSEILEIVASLINDYKKERPIDKVEMYNQPDIDVIHDIIKKLLKVVFPGFFQDKQYKYFNISSSVHSLVEDIVFNLEREVNLALLQCPSCILKTPEYVKNKTRYIVLEFLKKLPQIREFLATDVQAAFEGDPAAFNHNEIILAYPGIWATAINRLAHELYLLKVPLIPRIMTEYAHSKTGIDIHPGVKIGKYFFIDHGTGIVIGETSVIGNHVKIYQGVTIGALSTRAGQKLKGLKRHPTIEDYVTIYAGASILGGETVIGKNAVIGSNAFITSSIEKDAKVSIANQNLNIKSGTKKEIVQSENWFYII